MSMGWERGYMVYPIYGKSGGTRTDIAMTNAIQQSTQRDIEGDPYGPKIIPEDFNHTSNLLATVKDLMEEQQWMDVGSVADWWGGVPDEPTCHSRGKTQKARIDGYLVNLEALGAIHDYEVEKHEMIPTHSITSIELSRNAMGEEKTILGKLGSSKKAAGCKIQELRRNVMQKACAREEQKKLRS